MRKILAVMLVIIMTVSLASISAFADNEANNRAYQFGLEEEEEDVYVPSPGDRMLSDIFGDTDPKDSSKGEKADSKKDEPAKSEVKEETHVKTEPQTEPSVTKEENKEKSETAEYSQEAQTYKAPENSFAVVLKSNNGENEEKEVTGQGKFTFPECEFTYTGYAFDHWEMDGESYKAGDEIDLANGDYEAVAVWKWADGKIGIEFGLIRPDTYRTSMQFPRGSFMSWASLPYYSGGAAAIVNSEGKIVEQFVDQSSHTFSNLPAGTYKLRLTILDEGIYSTVESITGVGQNLVTEYETEITITEGSTSTQWKYCVVEFKAYGFKTTTELGTFENGKKENVYYTGGNWAYENTDPSSVGRCKTFNTHNGIYYNDSATLYNINVLEIPTLSEEDALKGYKFVGWRLQGDESGKVYREMEAVSYIVQDHVVFEAVWEHPTHKVKFSTSEEFGEINGSTEYSYDREFSDTYVDDIPTVTPKDGYEFIGWFNDLTVNVIPEDEISGTRIDRDLNFYAKYRKLAVKHTVKYLPGTDGTLTGTDMLILKDGSFIPTIPTVTPDEGARFTGKWKVTAVSDECDILAVGDVLNEIQISRLQIFFDVNLEAIYEKDTYKVTYVDGANNTAFEPETTEDLALGSSTPAYSKEPVREGYTFIGWSPAVSDTVTGDAVYVAQWVKNESDPGTDPEPSTDPDSGDSGSKKGGKKKGSPKTGDNTNLFLWLALACAALTAAAVAVFIILKKRNNKENETSEDSEE